LLKAKEEFKEHGIEEFVTCRHRQVQIIFFVIDSYKLINNFIVTAEKNTKLERKIFPVILFI